jgi:hypothetical protein
MINTVRFFVLVIFCVFVFISNAQSQNDSVNTTTATVYVIRATGARESLSKFPIFVNSDPANCKLANNHYVILHLDPGVDTFYLKSWWGDFKKKKKNGFPITLEAGKIYYLKVLMKDIILKVDFFFEEITANSAFPILEKLKLQEAKQ